MKSPGYHQIEILNGNISGYVDEEHIELYKLTKQELFNLPLGTIIKTNRPFKNIYIKVGEKDFCNDDCDHIEDNNVDNDLTIESYYGDKILEIQTPDYNTIYKYEEPKKPTREMTIEEIEKELGYPIKVIKEN